MPVAAFVLAFAPGTTRSATNDTATALQRHRRASARSYLRHSPGLLCLKHPDDHPGTGDHPGNSSPSRVSDALHPNGHVAGGFTSGRRRTSALPGGVVSAGPPCRMWTRDFSGQKREAPAYPSTPTLCGSAPSPFGLTGKPFAPCRGSGLSWLSSSPSGSLMPERRALSSARSRPSPDTSSPRRLRLNDPGSRARVEPPEGDSHPFAHHDPRRQGAAPGVSSSPRLLQPPGHPIG